MNDEEPGNSCQIAEIIEPGSKVVFLKDVFEEANELIEEYGDDKLLLELVDKLVGKAE